jgi:hypothetical protein
VLVMPDKYEQTKSYLSKALKDNWGMDVPLLGLIPDRPFLGCKAMNDLERQTISSIAKCLGYYPSRVSLQKVVGIIATYFVGPPIGRRNNDGITQVYTEAQL